MMASSSLSAWRGMDPGETNSLAKILEVLCTLHITTSGRHAEAFDTDLAWHEAGA